METNYVDSSSHRLPLLLSLLSFNWVSILLCNSFRLSNERFCTTRHKIFLIKYWNHSPLLVGVNHISRLVVGDEFIHIYDGSKFRRLIDCYRWSHIFARYNGRKSFCERFRMKLIRGFLLLDKFFGFIYCGVCNITVCFLSFSVSMSRELEFTKIKACWHWNQLNIYFQVNPLFLHVFCEQSLGGCWKRHSELKNVMWYFRQV